MSKVLGSFSADEAALHIAKRNIKPDELSLVFQEGGLSIYFFILSSCFLGGVSATNTKNIFRSSAVQPGSFSHESWITLALCPVNGSRAPRCGRHITCDFCRVCDSVVSRGVYLKGIVASFIILKGVLSSAGIYFILVKFIFSF